MLPLTMAAGRRANPASQSLTIRRRRQRDNRGGAAATIGHALGAKAPPDGYTLLLGTTGGLVSGPALMGSKIPYDPLKDFATIGLATYVPYAIAVTASLPANSVKELIELARAQPRKLNVASPGVGTPNHLGAAQLMTLTCLEIATTTPREYYDLLVSDLALWKKLIKDAKISVDVLP